MRMQHQLRTQEKDAHAILHGLDQWPGANWKVPGNVMGTLMLGARADAAHAEDVGVPKGG